MREVSCWERERFETRVRVRIGDLEMIIDSFMRHERDSESFFQGKENLKCLKELMEDCVVARNSTSLANK